MSNDPNDSVDRNPYAAAAPQHSPALDMPADLRPSGVTVTGVLCVLGGIMGLLMSFLTTAQLMLGNQLANAVTPAGAAGDPQREMSAAMEVLNSKFMIPNIGVCIGVLVLSCCLLVGGIVIFQRKPWVPTWLRRTFMALVVFEVLRQIMFAVMQVETYPIMQRYFTQLASTPNATGGAGSKAMMESMHTFSLIFGIVFAVGWALLKLGLFTWGYRYFGKRHVRAYFAESE